MSNSLIFLTEASHKCCEFNFCWSLSLVSIYSFLSLLIASNPNTHNSSDPHSATSTEPVNTKANWHSQLGGAQWPWGAWAVCQGFQTKTHQTWIHSGETVYLSAYQCGTWGLIFQVWRETAIPPFPGRIFLNRVMLWPLCRGFLRNNRKSHAAFLLPCWV